MSMTKFTYNIFNPRDHQIIPGTKIKYHDVVKYQNCDYLKYFRANSSKWKFEKGVKKQLTFSNFEDISYIKAYSNPLVRYISIKSNLAEMLNGEIYSPKTIIFTLQNSKIPELRNWNREKGSLWFLKKSSNITYGGFDVFPIIFNNMEETLSKIKKFIDDSNKDSKYYSEDFILQQGIQHPLLMPGPNGGLYKFDIRTYGLIVKVSKNHPYEFYFFKKFLNRRSMKPYDDLSSDPSVMLTNTTQGKELGEDISKLVSLGNSDDSPELFNPMYNIYDDLCNNHLSKFNNTDFNNPAINIIGIDFIFDSSYNCYILEINKWPKIICDKNDRKKYHFNMEDTMFADDFFDITFEAIEKKIPYKFSTENYFHVVIKNETR